MGTPRAADFYATNRGGGLFSEAISQRLGALVALGAYRLGLAPTVLTMANLLVGVATSIAVAALAGPMHDGRVAPLAVGLGALVAWQLAYLFDCADGQLARVTDRTSAAGRRVDVLCDVAMQVSLVAAVATVARAYHPSSPAWLTAVFAGSWMVNLVTSEMQKGEAAASLVTSRSLVVRLVKLIRDYGAIITVIALVIALWPAGTLWVMAAFAAVNVLFLLASIAAAARASLRAAA